MVKNHYYIISLAVIFLDQLLKFFFERNLDLNQTIPVIKNIFHITLVHNYGAGFGILQGTSLLLFWLGFIALGFILFYWDKIKTKEQKIFVAIIIGGIIGNMIDRIVLGYTVDFLDFRIWPAFNLADSCMLIGTAGFLYLLWKNK